MTLKEMIACADETLEYFIKVMPDVPFTKDDIVIEIFASHKKMVERVKAFCAEHIPDKILTAGQVKDLEINVLANALTGRKKSAVIMKANYVLPAYEFRTIIFHELMHIYCNKLEMPEDKHFIDIYGSGTTPTSDVSAEDGFLCSGYKIWSEFIAQYFALKMTLTKPYTVDQEGHYIEYLLSGVNINNRLHSKENLSMSCACFLTCSDADDEVELFKKIYDGDIPPKQRAFLTCLFQFHNQIKKEKPYEIDEDYIAQLGSNYTVLLALNK